MGMAIVVDLYTTGDSWNVTFIFCWVRVSDAGIPLNVD
jgi:hypothetical protein